MTTRGYSSHEQDAPGESWRVYLTIFSIIIGAYGVAVWMAVKL